ncbi:hypothetical protein [Streptomyces tropicalis]|uniref:Uncharacterized protein n=1 Tax=Streptomyces tropicalis TaxID=3034234 RepID=A0ABT6ACX0_9ACTN|nr:hypothetical protein [Streptomyces tropicalis]MDF3302500.1 hypothetical protein [Streptomyces tropicalis]
MTGPDVPHGPRPSAGADTAAQRQTTVGGCGAGSPDDPSEWASATNRPRPVDGCPDPAQVPTRSRVNLRAPDHGGPDHDTVLCRRCGGGVSVEGSPKCAEDMAAPPPHEAYANAPDLRREMHQVLALGAERDGRRTRSVTGPPVDAPAAERAWLLRRASLMDRMALDDPGPALVAAAAQTAEQLVLHDRRHPDLVAGPHHPDAITLTPSRRLYVRQEYAAWTAAGRPGT